MGKISNNQRMEEIELLCRLSESELEEESKRLTQLLIQKGRTEEEKKIKLADYNEQIKQLEEEIEEQVPIVADRQKRKMVSCLIEYNKPSLGKKTITRLDTGAEVGIMDMNEDEKQDIFYNSDSSSEEPPTGEEGAEGLTPIHIGKPAPGNDNAIKLEAGKLYEIEGTIYRAEEETKDGRCKGCVFDGCDDLCIAYGLDCIDVILVKAKGDNKTGHPSEEEKPAEEETENNSEAVPLQKRLMFCEKCLHPGTLYHVDREKLLCDRCLEQKNQKNLSKIETAIAEKRRILVRPQFGYGCRSEFADCTCFRFTIYGNEEKLYASWGSPVYLPGDYREENTDAANYYKKLIDNGVEEG